jgi:hypothetical protein
MMRVFGSPTHYVQQKLITRTLQAASTLTQKLPEEAKLRVHDFPPKDKH